MEAVDSALAAPGGRIRLEFVPADPQRPDPFAINEEMRHASLALRADGYAVTRPYTGTRGAEVLELAKLAGQVVAEHKDLLIAVLTFPTPVVQYIFGRQAQRREDKEQDGQSAAAAQPAQRAPTILVEVSGASIRISAADSADPRALAARIRREHPQVDATLSPSGTIVLKVPVRRSEPRRRR